MATRDNIIDTLRSYLATMSPARDPSATLLAHDLNIPFEESADSGIESFDVQSGAFNITQTFGVDGAREWDGELVVKLGHTAFGTEPEREAWVSRDVERISDLVENTNWAPEGVSAVWFLGQGETNRFNPNWWITELRFRVVYIDDGTNSISTPPSAPSFTIAMANVIGLAAALAGYVSKTVDETIDGAKTFAKALTVAAKLTITSVVSGENAIEIPDGSRIKLGSDANAYIYASGNTILVPATLNAANVYADNFLQRSTTKSLVLSSQVVDGPNTAIVADTRNLLTDASARLVSFRNNGTEKAYVNAAGTIVAPLFVATSSSGLTGNSYISIRGTYAACAVRIGSLTGLTGNILELYSDNLATLKAWFDKDGWLHAPAIVGAQLYTGQGFDLLKFQSNGPTVVGSEAVDGATAIGIKINTQRAFSTAGAKLLSIQNAGVEKVFVDRNGGLQATTLYSGGFVYAGSGFAANGLTNVSLVGRVADSANAIGAVINNTASLFTPGAKIVSFQNAGVEKAFVHNDGYVYSEQGLALLSNFTAKVSLSAGSGIFIRGAPVNNASAVACRIGSFNTLTTAGAKIVGFYNDNGATEKASFDKDGKLTISGVASSQDAISIPQGSRLNLGSGNRYIYDNGAHIAVAPNVPIALTGGIVDGGTVRIMTPVGGSLTFRSNVPDAANSVVCYTDNVTALTTAGALLHSFRNATVEKSRVDKDGNYENTVAGEGIILKSPNGTRYKVTVADDGTLTTAAV